jgi:hypothetical protein
MRANEFINEAEGVMNSNFADTSQGVTRLRDKGGYDRTYHLNRIWMATAMADGKSADPVEMDSSSWIEKYNVAVPYTDAEHLMIMSAMATIPSDGQELQKRSKSVEPKDTYTVSPVNNWNKQK